jgi:hypothetical protein
VDYDNDGQMDLWVTYYNEASRLYHNNGDGTFTKQLMGGGSQNCQPAWGDYDNDGNLDLFLSRGQGADMTSQLWRNNGDGTFTPVTLGSPVTDLGKSVSAAWGDYDNDGFLDLFVARTKGEANALYHNNGNTNHWLMVKPVATRSNRAAIGAKVHVQARINGKTFWQMREISGGNRCQNDLRPHFGLGDATNVMTLQFDWPSGTTENFTNVAPNQILTIVEPSLSGAFTADGKFHLAVYGSANRSYVVEWSPDLVGWTTLATVPGQGPTPVEVVDPTVPAAQQRFYRLVLP